MFIRGSGFFGWSTGVPDFHDKRKHGIDSEESKALWFDINRLEVQTRSDDEVRYALIALLNEKPWTAFYTVRDDQIRHISVRRSRKGERDLYHES